MALARWTSTVQDEAGNAVAGAQIEVRSEFTNLLVPLYADRDGTVPLGNPFASPSAQIAFHTAGGAYRITAIKGEFQAQWRYVPIGTLQEQDIEQVVFALQSGMFPAGTLADLQAFVPAPGTRLAGIVLADPTPSKNGYYLYQSGAWAWQRPLPDTLARLAVVGGDGNNVLTSASPGVDPGKALAFFIDLSTSNTGPVTISVNGGAALPVRDYRGNDFMPGQFTGRIFLSNEVTHLREIVGSDIVARAFVQADRAEDGADRAEDAATRAEAAASGVQYPVSYAPQTLTAAQQQQALNNLGMNGARPIGMGKAVAAAIVFG